MLEIHLFGRFREHALKKGSTDNSIVKINWIKGETVVDLAKRIEISPDDLGEIFINHWPQNDDYIIPKDARVALFPLGMHLLCGGQHMKGHGYITKKVKPADYWQKKLGSNKD